MLAKAQHFFFSGWEGRHEHQTITHAKRPEEGAMNIMKASSWECRIHSSGFFGI